MAILEVNATRMELSKLKVKLDVAKKGHKLLKSKCDGITRKILQISEEHEYLKKEVNDKIKHIISTFELAKIETSAEEINFILSIFKAKNLLVKVLQQNIMGVKLPHLEIENFENIKNFDFVLSQNSQYFDEGVRLLFELLPKLIQLAEQEKLMKRLQKEVIQTRRKVNALEYMIMPDYVDTIRAISLKLEENERNNIARLSKVKKKIGFM